MLVFWQCKTFYTGAGIFMTFDPMPPCTCSSGSCNSRHNWTTPSFLVCLTQKSPCGGSCESPGAWSVGRSASNQPEAANKGRAFPRCLRVPVTSYILRIIVIFLIAAKPSHMPQRTYGNGQASSSPSWDAKAVPISLFFQVAAWFASISVTSFGPEFASASLCAVNICNGGTCYEHGTAQVCVCPLPFKGPTCTEKASLCIEDCGIRSNSGLDCQSALCSLGVCVDTDVSPYFKCECGDFFQGTNCEQPSNPCTGAVNPCGQGTCIFSPGKGTGTVTCQCHDDWEVASGVGVVTTKWGNSEVVMNPPCSVRVSRGLANIPFTLSSGELVFWWTVFATALCVLLWCCYTVAAESCSSCFRKFKIAGQVQNAARA